METTQMANETAIGSAMTYDQAIQYGYAAQVEAVGRVNADYSHRLMPDPTVVEFTAAHHFTGADGCDYTITACYYQDQADLNACEDGDLGSLDWTVSKYEIS